MNEVSWTRLEKNTQSQLVLRHHFSTSRFPASPTQSSHIIRLVIIPQRLVDALPSQSARPRILPFPSNLTLSAQDRSDRHWRTRQHFRERLEDSLREIGNTEESTRFPEARQSPRYQSESTRHSTANSFRWNRRGERNVWRGRVNASRFDRLGRGSRCAEQQWARKDRWR